MQHNTKDIYYHLYRNFFRVTSLTQANVSSICKSNQKRLHHGERDHYKMDSKEIEKTILVMHNQVKSKWIEEYFIT